MQTFLPYPDFVQSVQVLDWRRLGKQRSEASQILTILSSKSTNIAWRRHPAVVMWEGHLEALAAYMDCAILEWIRRGYVNNMVLSGVKLFEAPSWFGDPEFHSIHRAVLLGKNLEWYSQFNWPEAPAVKQDGRWPYKWPSRSGGRI